MTPREPLTVESVKEFREHLIRFKPTVDATNVLDLMDYYDRRAGELQAEVGRMRAAYLLLIERVTYGREMNGKYAPEFSGAEIAQLREAIAPGAAVSAPLLCQHCGKPANDSKHIKYGPDIDNPAKHEFEPQQLAPDAPPLTAAENDRRCALIEQHIKATITDAESQELAALNCRADAMVSEAMRPQIEALKRWRAESLPDAARDGETHIAALCPICGATPSLSFAPNGWAMFGCQRCSLVVHDHGRWVLPMPDAQAEKVIAPLLQLWNRQQAVSGRVGDYWTVEMFDLAFREGLETDGPQLTVKRLNQIAEIAAHVYEQILAEHQASHSATAATLKVAKEALEGAKVVIEWLFAEADRDPANNDNYTRVCDAVVALKALGE